MPVIWWNGPADGKGSVEDVVSHTREVVNALHDSAEDLRDIAAAILQTSYKTENAQIKVQHHGQLRLGWRPDLDSVVYLEASETIKNPTRPYTEEDHQRRAAIIEFRGVGPLWNAVKTMDRGGR